MSTWISRVGGIRNVTPGSQLLLSVSGKRVPTASMTSASAASRLAAGEPQNPIIPRSCGWSGGRTPVPISVWTTGMPGALGELADLADGAPRAAAGQEEGRARAAQLGGDGLGGRRRERRPLATGEAGTTAASRGSREDVHRAPTRGPDPGRPASAVSQARARMRGTWSARRTRQARLTNGSYTDTWSASRRRLNSWCGPRPS